MSEAVFVGADKLICFGCGRGVIAGDRVSFQRFGRTRRRIALRVRVAEGADRGESGALLLFYSSEVSCKALFVVLHALKQALERLKKRGKILPPRARSAPRALCSDVC